jgi:hypothetical protein
MVNCAVVGAQRLLISLSTMNVSSTRRNSCEFNDTIAISASMFCIEYGAGAK